MAVSLSRIWSVSTEVICYLCEEVLSTIFWLRRLLLDIIVNPYMHIVSLTCMSTYSPFLDIEGRNYTLGSLNVCHVAVGTFGSCDFKCLALPPAIFLGLCWDSRKQERVK